MGVSAYKMADPRRFFCDEGMIKGLLVDDSSRGSDWTTLMLHCGHAVRCGGRKRKRGSGINLAKGTIILSHFLFSDFTSGRKPNQSARSYTQRFFISALGN